MFNMGKPLPSYWEVTIPWYLELSKEEAKIARERARAVLKEHGIPETQRCKNEEEARDTAARLSWVTKVDMIAQECSPL